VNRYFRFPGLGAVLALSLFAISPFPSRAYAAGGDSKAEIRCDAPGALTNSAVVAFPSPFSSVPVVVVSGQWMSQAWLAASRGASPSNFTLAFYNPNSKAPIVGTPTGTWIQYIALVPDPDSTDLTAAKVSASDGATIAFGKSLSDIPAVICSAVDLEGKPLFANPSDISSGSFVIHLYDMNGDAAKGSLSYIALTSASPLVVEGATLYAGAETRAPGESDLSFGITLKDNPAVVLCSPFLAGTPTVRTTHSFFSTTLCGGSLMELRGGRYGDLSSGTAKAYWIAVVK
jgi:hypothetical protein